MPHPKGNLKLSGDTHLPDAESELDVEEGSSGLAELAKDRHQPRGAATRVRRAGVLTAGEAQEKPEAKGREEGSVGAGGTDEVARVATDERPIPVEASQAA